MRLQGKVAIVTGGGSGIGEATAKVFAREGAKVAIADISEQAQRVVDAIHEDGGEAVYIPCNVAKESEVEQLVAQTVNKFGKLDILVANAGISSHDLSHELSVEHWNHVLSINLGGVFLTNKYAIRQMLENGKGSIVNIASVAGLVGKDEGHSYSASKAGVVNLTRSEGISYAKSGIRVNAICPGYVKTPMIAGRSDELYESYKDIQPIGRFGEPEEIAKACLFLASDDSSFVTATALCVDGGYTAQ